MTNDINIYMNTAKLIKPCNITRAKSECIFNINNDKS